MYKKISFLNNMQRYRLVSFGYKVSLIKSNARLPHHYEKRKIRENFYFSYITEKAGINGVKFF